VADQFVGFIALADDFFTALVVRNTSGTPSVPDATPTYRVYGESGLMTNGTGSAAALNTGVVTAASNAAPIVITSVAHGLNTGTRVTVASVGGNTAANGTFIVTRVSNDTFSLDGSTGNGAYTSGGTWKVTGLFSVGFTVTAGNGFEAGKTYSVIASYAVSSTSLVQQFTFVVV
jgi:hypothetical protein